MLCGNRGDTTARERSERHLAGYSPWGDMLPLLRGASTTIRLPLSARTTFFRVNNARSFPATVVAPVSHAAACVRSASSVLHSLGKSNLHACNRTCRLILWSCRFLHGLHGAQLRRQLRHGVSGNSKQSKQPAVPARDRFGGHAKLFGPPTPVN